MGLSEFLAERAAKSRRTAAKAAEKRAQPQQAVRGVKKLHVDTIPVPAGAAGQGLPAYADAAVFQRSPDAGPQQRPAANPPATSASAAPVFAVDRAKMFDLQQTAALFELVQVPAERRDARWQAAFITAAWNASLEVPADPFFHGPDGFVYLRLQVPSAGAFESNSMSNQAADSMEQMRGIAIFGSPAEQHAQYVFSMGMLDSLLRYDTWLGDPADRRPAGAGAPLEVAREHDGMKQFRATGEHEVLLGTPSADYLPPVTARALYAHMTQGWQMSAPKVQLRVDPAMEPSRSLMINRRMSDFADPEEGAAQCQRLLWYLPPNRAVSLLPDDWNDSGMTPLAELCGEQG